jgi:hypothetical protein
MSAADPARLVRPADRVEGERTPGMTREQAIAVDGMWAGLVRTEAHMMTGWHHHADYDTTVYVVDGSLRMESGPGEPRWLTQAQATSCTCRRAQSTERATRATRSPGSLCVRAGSGPAVVNVDGPAPG